MKIKLTAVCVCLCLMLSACGKKEAVRSDDAQDNSVQTSIDSERDREIITDEAEAEEYKAVVAAMLDCFQALDYEGAMEYIRESDRGLFDFSDSSQQALYNSLFAKLSYSFGDVYTMNGRIFVETDITAPDMLYVYGEVNLRYIDAIMNLEVTSEEESREFNNRALEEIVNEDGLEMKTMTVQVELMRDSDGVERTVFTAELMNAMLGDIQTAQAQVSEAIEDGLEEYNTAKDSGMFDE